jgi:hypothetical protein
MIADGLSKLYFLVEDFRLVLEVDAGLTAFFAGALVVLVLAAVLAFAAGVFPVTAFLAESRREEDVVFFVVVVLDLAAGDFVVFLTEAFGLVAALVEVAFDLLAGAALVDDDFEAVGFLAAVLVAVGFLAIVVFLVVRVVDLVAAALVAFVALDATGLDFVAAAGLVAFEAGFAAGLFSLVSDASVLAAFFGGNLTRPDGPLGKTRVPLSAPVEIALLS